RLQDAVEDRRRRPHAALPRAAAGPVPCGGRRWWPRRRTRRWRHRARRGARGAGNAPTSFGIVTLAGASTIVNGASPALSRDGRYAAWVLRSGTSAAAGQGEQKLLVAPIDKLASPGELHKGMERLDAPALSPDGSRVAFQMMTNDDWEIYVSAREGEDEVRVTREIQHDIAPQFLGGNRLLALIGEPRHRRSYVYDLAHPTAGRTRLFHNNTVRTIAPEYAWVPSADG